MIKMLMNLLKIFNGTGTDFVSHFVKKWLNENNIDFQEDKYGNIFNFKHSNAPFLSAHMDSVQTKSDIYAGSKLTIEGDKIYSPGHIIGADDLVGVWIILTLLKEGNHRFNWILSDNEEIGAIGADDFITNNSQLIRDSLYGLVIDRKGSSDIICSHNLYGTKRFEETLHTVSNKNGFNYKPERGVFSDANVWSDYISCANLSCGYYNMHSTNEHIIIPEMLNSKEYIKSILVNVTEKFPSTDKVITQLDDPFFDDIFGIRKTSWNSDEDFFWNNYERCGICDSIDDAIYYQSIDKTLCNSCLTAFIDEVESIHGRV